MNEREMAHRVWLGWFAGGMILGITTGLAMDQPSIGFALHLWACVHARC